MNRRTWLTAIMALPFVRWLSRTEKVVVANRTQETIPACEEVLIQRVAANQWQIVGTDCISVFRHLETGELLLFPTAYNPVPPGTQWERMVWDCNTNELVTFIE